MSKRFGRNQKRKLVEKLRAEELRSAGLQRDLKMLSARHRDLTRRMEEWARAIRSRLGPEHPFNEKVMEIMELRLPELRDRKRFAPRVSIDHIFDGPATFIDTVVHLVEVEASIEDCSVRCIIRAPDRTAAYLIDHRELHLGRKDPRFLHWIAEALFQKFGSEAQR